MAGPDHRNQPAGTPAVLAVDGGASKTDVVIVDAEGSLLGSARGPGSNHQMVGAETAMDNLAKTVADAAVSAGQAPTRLPLCPTGVYCLAGVDLSVDEDRVGKALATRGFTETVDLRNDTFAVLRAGVRSGWGVGVVCGTGLNCAALGPDANSVRFPSLGELSGDYTPGGAWLGVRGLGLALRAGDGRGEPTVLRKLVADYFGCESPEQVLHEVYVQHIGFGRLPELAEVVLGAARDGDQPAVGAVDQLAREVVTMVDAAIRRLGVGQRPIEVVVGGGLFDEPSFFHRVLTGIQVNEPGAALRPLRSPPVLGAALLGLDAIAAGPDAQERLRASFEAAAP